MPRPVTGRRPDSLFDNRYRYDHIYPRGRSGETLRAYDTLQDGLPVVIKRPALQDAPPIRAGQEVNILNEKRALEVLSGHPVLTELRQSGTFRVGGQTHHYIVMDMAQGETVESMVIALAEQGKRLPDLEMLNILDGLLDLLQAAHDHHLVYNDVDAKHLFWDREHYRLKLIDWGNVVFLESDHAPAHVTHAADILQTGQMIYFLLSGGHRLESGGLDPANSLGEDVPFDLKVIINRAVHPELAQRYPDIAALRHDLAEVRRPIQKNREMLVERVRGRLANATNQTQFEALRDDLLEALIVDPGYPPAREMLVEIETRLKQLAMQGDLDAVRIYIESGNLGRASDLLDEMTARMGDVESPLLLFLQDVCDLLDEQAQTAGTPPVIAAGLAPALDALYRDDPQAAGRALVTTSDPRPEGQLQQFLLAERLTQRMAGLVLLRPHLVRLADELGHLIAYNRLVQAVRNLNNKLDVPVGPGIQPLIRVYQYIADILVGLDDDLKGASDIRGPLGHHPACTVMDIANRARQTADDVVELLEVVAQNVLSDSSRAGNALWRASAIDPINPAFDALNNLLNVFHTDLGALREFTPAADGANIANYLAHARMQLEPYQADISDSQFQAVVRGIDLGLSDWEHVMDFVALGGRRPAVEFCRLAVEHVRPLSRATALWFEDYERRIEDAPHVEALSPNGALGRALADGWDAWDRGRTAEAMLAGKRAADGAATEAEKVAARRLISLGEALDKWLDRSAQTTAAQIEAAERRALALFLPEEEAIRQKFATQMPNMPIYVKAMGKGVVDPLRETSSAGIRVLFFDYVLRGMLALQKEQFDEANTWKDAAGKTLSNARLHPAYQTLENAIVTRQLILEAVRVLNATKNVAGLPEARQAVRAPLAAVQLEQAEQSLRAIDDALRRWADGEFHAARQLLDTAMERASMAQNAAGKDLGPFKAWLQDLADSAEILAQARRVIDQAALVPADKPEPEVAEALQKLVDLTRRDLGESYTAQLRQWRDTYTSIRDVYLDGTLARDDKLRLLEGHFASLFIDRQPALPIFRHWQGVIRSTTDPEPEPVRSPEPDIPTFLAGRGDVYTRETAPLEEIDDAEPIEAYVEASEPAAAPVREPREPRQPRSPRARSAPPSPLIFVIGGLGLIAAVIALVAIIGGRGSGGDVVPTVTSSSGALLASVSPTTPSKAVPTFTLLPPTSTPVPPLPTPIPLTTTPEAPVPMPTHGTPIPTGELISPATLAALPTITPPGQPTLGAGPMPGTPLPTNPGIVLPTLLPDAQGGDYDMLKALPALDSKRITWDQDWFARREGQWQLGNPTLKPGRAPLIRLGSDVLASLFGADAARYLKRVDVTLELVNYDQSLLPTGNVYFGAGFESIQGQRAAVEARLVQANVLDLGISLNARFLPKTQLPVTNVKLALAVERNADRTLSLYVNGQLLGASNAAYAPDVPVSIYLYTSTGGVTVNVTSLTIHLDKQ